MGTRFRWNLASVWAANLGDGIALAAGPLWVASQTAQSRHRRGSGDGPAGAHACWILACMPVRSPTASTRTRLVVIANWARGLVIAAMGLTIVTGAISIWVVLASLFLAGIAEVLVDSGTRTVLPMIVSKADLGIGNARLMTGYLVANQLAGPRSCVGA